MNARSYFAPFYASGKKPKAKKAGK